MGLISSLEVCEKLNLKHKDVLGKLRRLKKRGFLNYEVDSYKNSRGRYYDFYKFDSIFFKYFELNASSLTKSEVERNAFGKTLKKFFKLNIVEEYRIGRYYVDFVFPCCNLIVEYYETRHDYTKEKDKKRISEIFEISNKFMDDNYKLSGYDVEKDGNYFNVVIVKEGFEVEGLREILENVEGNSDCLENVEHFNKSLDFYFPDMISDNR